MMKKGLMEEAKALHPLREYPAMKTVGYRELFNYFDGELRLDDAIQQIKNNTRKYARKQRTWFRKGNLYTWFHPSDISGMIQHITSIIQRS